MSSQTTNAVRKIITAGGVTVTGPATARVLKQHQVHHTTIKSTTISSGASALQQVGSVVPTSSPSSSTSVNALSPQILSSLQNTNNTNRCYVCDEVLSTGHSHSFVSEMKTSHTSLQFTKKLAELVGDPYLVLVSVEDIICPRCTNLVNYLDRLENDVDRVRTNLISLLNKKYGMVDESESGGTKALTNNIGGSPIHAPPTKLQKLNSGITIRAASTGEELSQPEVTRARKIVQANNDAMGKQSPSVSAVQQIKISTQSPTHGGGPNVTSSPSTIQRKTTKIYKCLSCEYKTSDMKLFNSHYETCKQQNFQCKNCKKIFANFGSMKQHMVREHQTAMDHTCAVCHINLINEVSLRKHMESHHATNVLVTSTGTLPAGATMTVADQMNSSVYSCSNCSYKAPDKATLEEHLRKHLSSSKPKPFKCRLCSQRFETRDAATLHAKQHQPNFFKCGTCQMSFPKRESLVKHFETVHPQAQNKQVLQQHQKQAGGSQHQNQQQQQAQMTTQKLLDEIITRNIGDSAGATNTTGVAGVPSGTTVAATADDLAAAAGGNNIRFFSCQSCSLTFIQETYYNQHMETHRHPNKNTGSGPSGGVTNANVGGASSVALNSAATALLSDGVKSGAAGGSTAALGSASGQQSSSAIDADIESIFEKMHSETKGEEATTNSTTGPSASSNAATGGDNLVITSQGGSDGGITFNITIPQAEGVASAGSKKANSKSPGITGNAAVSVSIDMPMLDQPDEPPAHKIEKVVKKESKSNGPMAMSKGNKNAAPVSMPSLDDDNDVDMGVVKMEEGGEKKSEDAANRNATNPVKVEDVKLEKSNSEESAAATNANETRGDESQGSNATGGEGEHQTNSTGEEHQQHQQQVTMELDEAMQAQVESGQIKFILNENGQLLQLNDHIITDAEGNQILVQDPEQIQQLLQSVGVLHSGDGLEGETLQMMTDANGTQMVLVQGENNETQLIDASLLNADGQLVIQQGPDGELGEGAHVIGEDGTRIPVSVSYTADGQPIVQVQQQVLETASADENSADSSLAGGEQQQHHIVDKEGVTTNAVSESSGQQTAADAAGNGGGSGVAIFNFEDLMQESAEAKPAE